MKNPERRGAEPLARTDHEEPAGTDNEQEAAAAKLRRAAEIRATAKPSYDADPTNAEKAEVASGDFKAHGELTRNRRGRPRQD